MRGGQAPGWYRMTLGKFEITALSDGTIQAPVDRFLHGVPPAREKALLERAYLESPVETSVNGFLVNTGRKLMLIDAGAGGLYGPVLGKLVPNLEASGYFAKPVEITNSEEEKSNDTDLIKFTVKATFEMPGAKKPAAPAPAGAPARRLAQ